MTNAVIRQQLHQYIDVADDKKIEAVYTIVQRDMGNEKYTPEELDKFYNTLGKYLKGEMPVFGVEEAHDYVISNYG